MGGIESYIVVAMGIPPIRVPQSLALRHLWIQIDVSVEMRMVARVGGGLICSLF